MRVNCLAGRVLLTLVATMGVCASAQAQGPAAPFPAPEKLLDAQHNALPANHFLQTRVPTLAQYHEYRLNLSVAPQERAGDAKQAHLVSFTSGDVVAAPQVLYGDLSPGKAELSGTFRAAYNFEKWIANTNQGDASVYEILRKAQAAAGGALTGRALFKVDANAVVNSFITVVVEVGGDAYTIKLYTCVDHRRTTVTETDAEIIVSQVQGTACAYKAPLCAWSNEGEDLVYKITK